MNTCNKRLMLISLCIVMTGFCSDVFSMRPEKRKTVKQQEDSELADKRRRRSEPLQIDVIPDAVAQCILVDYLPNEDLAELGQVSKQWEINTRAEVIKRNADHVARNVAQYVYDYFIQTASNTLDEDVDELQALMMQLRQASYKTDLWFNGFSLRGRDYTVTLKDAPVFYRDIAKMFNEFYQAHKGVMGITGRMASMLELIPQYFQSLVKTDFAPKLFQISGEALTREALFLGRALSACYNFLLGIDSEGPHTQFDQMFEDQAQWISALKPWERYINVPVIIAANQLFEFMHCMDFQNVFKENFNKLHAVLEQHLPLMAEQFISDEVRKARTGELRAAMNELFGIELPPFVIQ